MAKVNPEDFGLPLNPFHNTATESAPFWAGMPDIKKRMENIIQSVLPSDLGTREVVVMHGEFGNGKTHAMRYFARKIKESKSKEGYAFFIGKARQNDKLSFASLFYSLIKECGNDFFSDLANKVINTVDEEWHTSRSSEGAPKTSTKEELISKLVNAADFDMVSHLYHANSNDYAKFFEPNDDYDAVSKLASLISIMTSPIGGQKAPYSAVYLFFDEMEEVLDTKPAQFFAFFSSCRELINKTKQNCAVFFAFTTDAASLDAQIPPQIQERLTRKNLELTPFDDKGAKDFIREFLQHIRIDGYSTPHPFYPFSEEAVDILLERTDVLVPRKILNIMMHVFERAIRNKDIDIDKGISKDTAEKILDAL